MNLSVLLYSPIYNQELCLLAISTYFNFITYKGLIKYLKFG